METHHADIGTMVQLAVACCIGCIDQVILLFITINWETHYAAMLYTSLRMAVRILARLCGFSRSLSSFTGEEKNKHVSLSLSLSLSLLLHGGISLRPGHTNQHQESLR